MATIDILDFNLEKLDNFLDSECIVIRLQLLDNDPQEDFLLKLREMKKLQKIELDVIDSIGDGINLNAEIAYALQTLPELKEVKFKLLSKHLDEEFLEGLNELVPKLRKFSLAPHNMLEDQQHDFVEFAKKCQGLEALSISPEMPSDPTIYNDILDIVCKSKTLKELELNLPISTPYDEIEDVDEAQYTKYIENLKNLKDLSETIEILSINLNFCSHVVNAQSFGEGVKHLKKLRSLHIWHRFDNKGNIESIFSNPSFENNLQELVIASFLQQKIEDKEFELLGQNISKLKQLKKLHINQPNMRNVSEDCLASFFKNLGHCSMIEDLKLKLWEGQYGASCMKGLQEFLKHTKNLKKINMIITESLKMDDSAYKELALSFSQIAEKLQVFKLHLIDHELVTDLGMSPLIESIASFENLQELEFSVQKLPKISNSSFQKFEQSLRKVAANLQIFRLNLEQEGNLSSNECQKILNIIPKLEKAIILEINIREHPQFSAAECEEISLLLNSLPEKIVDFQFRIFLKENISQKSANNITEMIVSRKWRKLELHIENNGMDENEEWRELLEDKVKEHQKGLIVMY